MKTKYEAKGYWKVSTEGDCEGRSTRDLGTHFGYLDDIALALADKCYYSLCFKWVNPKELNQEPKATSVQVSLDIDSDTWNLKKEQRIEFFEKLLQGRPVFVEDGSYYASVKLNTTRPGLPKSIARDKALAKLNREDREALGL